MENNEYNKVFFTLAKPGDEEEAFYMS